MYLVLEIGPVLRGGRADTRRRTGCGLQGRNFRTCLRETENIIDEKQHVLVALVPEKFRHGEGGKSDAQARARRFVHLAENHSHFRLRQIFLIDHTSLTHLGIKIIAFAAAFTDAGEHGNTAVTFGDVVDELHDDNGFTNTGAAKRAYFAPFRKWADEVDDFDPGFQNLYFRVLFGEIRGFTMDRITLFKFYGTAVIDRIARHIKKAAEYTFTHWHRDWSASIAHAHPALETLR